ncbi:TPA: DNA gyrase subunit A, partial [Candidatus Peregrinibacteria bacterium]|nr:DNA gyrase subunit A [Candidatus Peregrinibacteria bacterium]
LMISMFTSNHNNLLYFTSNGRVFSLPAYEIPEASRTAKGKAIVNFLNMQEGETITSILDITKNTGKYLFFCTEGGVVKRSETELFSNIRQNGLKAVGLKENDQLKWVQPCNSGDEVMIVTSEGKGIRFEADEIRSMGRTAAGVRGIKLKISDKVVGMDIVKEGGDESTMLVVMQNGLGKITKVSAYRKQGRGGSGMKTANVTKKTGLVVSAKILEKNADCDLILSAKSGQAIRLSSSSVPSQGRSTQGVILMRLPAGDTVSSVSIIQNISEDGVEEDSAEDSSAQTVLL